MKKSPRRSNGRRSVRAWLRRGHRWLGLVAIFFVLELSVTGIALNHSSDWALDRRFVRWDWALSALGIQAPEPSSSFADRGHRVTLLGQRIYFDTGEIPYETESLVGMVVLEPLAVIATPNAALLLTSDGQFVQRIDLTTELQLPVRRIGRADGQPVFETADGLFVADADVTAFVPWPGGLEANIAWSADSDPEGSEIEILRRLYRGRDLTVERLVVEIHSGRIFSRAGPLIVDLAAVGFISLGLSGLAVWRWGRSVRRTPEDTSSNQYIRNQTDL